MTLHVQETRRPSGARDRDRHRDVAAVHQVEVKMIDRILRLGIVGSLLSATAAASAQPSYCPTTSPSACGQAQIGDILIGLYGTGRIIGLRPSTGAYYVFSTAFATGSPELGDLAVLPSNPVETLALGRIDDGFTGVRRLDACGNLVSTTYGTFPDPWPLPFHPFTRAETSSRGLVFSPVNAEAYSPGPLRPLLNGSVNYEPLFRFPHGGGTGSLVAIDGEIVDSVQRGAIGADERGNVYIGASNGSTLTRVGASGILNLEPHAVGLSYGEFNSIHDVVHDGNHHLFITDLDGENHGRVWRHDLLTRTSQIWADNRGSFGDGGPLNELAGITIDAWGDLWVAERYNWSTQQGGALKISGHAGGVIGAFTMPEQLGPNGEAAAGAEPNGIAVYGVNLPTIRERCAGTCNQNEVSECFGGCIAADAIGDGFCDDGPHVSLNCHAREFDGGDCNYCNSWETPDCNGNCAPKGWLGDGICDAGGWQYGGQWIDFDCPAFRFDEAVCASCNVDETLDCNGNCAPLGWLGDSICDDGDYEYLGNFVDLDCAEYDFDQGTCQ
jgi:hypothetical protein